MINFYSSLEQDGFVVMETSESEFLLLAKELGTPIPSRKHSDLIDLLQPKQKEQAHKASLSNIYGETEFPYHTDGAYFTIPPKYICLRYLKGISKPTSTKILPILNYLKPLEKECLFREFYFVRGRHFSFYTSILEKRIDKGDFFIRFDPGCMRSRNHSTYFEDLITEKIAFKNLVEIEWYEGKTIIINNWKTLHSRPHVQAEELNYRTLQRIMINE